MKQEYKALTYKEFEEFINILEKGVKEKKPKIKVATGEQGAIIVARECIKLMGKDNPSDEECLQFARQQFEYNGRGGYII
jgi:hypothetical protein